MLILLALPVIAAVAALYRYLQFYAPTNLLTRRVRARDPRWRTAAGLIVLAGFFLVAMHVLTGAVTRGAPGWLNLVVLVLAWDAIKVVWLAVVVGFRAASHSIRRGRRGRRSAISSWEEYRVVETAS